MTSSFRNRILAGGGEVAMNLPAFPPVEEEMRGSAGKPIRRARRTVVEPGSERQESPRSERRTLLTEMTGKLNHEMRDLLAVMRASSHLLRTNIRSDDPRVLTALKRIECGVARCDRILDGFVDLTHVARADLEPTMLDLWLAELVGGEALPAGVTLRRELGLPGAIVNFDRDRLGWAVLNVFDMACQALGEGAEGAPVREHCLVMRTGESGGRVEIVLEDNGPSIPADGLPTIFEPPFGTREFGIGLGLPVIKRIMEQHAGGVEIDSAEGRGTRVCLWLPSGNRGD